MNSSNNILFQDKINKSYEKDLSLEIANIWNKIHSILLKYEYGRKDKMNSQTKFNYIIHEKHKGILKKEINKLFNKNIKNIKSFLKQINKCFQEDILNSYKEILIEKKNIVLYDFDDNQVDEYIKNINNLYWIKNETLKSITKVEKLDLENIDYCSSVKGESSLNLEEILNQIISDFENIFWYTKFWDKNFSEWTNKYYWLDSSYLKYDSNIFSYIDAVNKIINRNIIDLNNSLENLIDMVWNEKIIQVKHIIIYNSLKKFLGDIWFLK